jgi:NTE family protein
VTTKKKHPPSAVKPVNLALQGGGAHGAYSWGVLEQLLKEDSIDIEAVSGTSAGAVNAVILAQGLMEGGRERAAGLLDTFWNRIALAASFSPLQPTPIDKFFGNYDVSYSPGFYAMDFFTRIFSPYQYNIFDLNPLRSILEDIVDFKQIRKKSPIKLFINATHVKSGKIRVFKTEEMTVDMVLASACLPFVFKTVWVDDEPYWDGGYSGNPALYPLFYSCASEDIMLVQVNPIHTEEVPTSAMEIMDRVNEISFNATLMREMRAIQFVKKLLEDHKVPESYYKNIRLHRIEASDIMRDLGAASKFNADRDFLHHLRNVGTESTRNWMQENGSAIGHRATVDIPEEYL